MPTRGPLPNTNAGLLAWSANLIKAVGDDPDRFGLSEAQFDGYRALHEAFASAQRAVSAPATRTTVRVSERNDRRTALKADARRLLRLIAGQVALDDAQRALLGMTVPKVRSPIGAPDATPAVHVLSVEGHRITIRVTDPLTPRGAKPPGVAAARIYVHTGESPPTRPDEWRFYGQTTRNRTTIDLNDDTGAMTVWIAACWCNPRGIAGPQSHANPTSLPAIRATPTAGLNAA